MRPPELRKLLRPAEPPVLVQQLQLVVGNKRSTCVPAMLLMLLVRYAVHDVSSPQVASSLEEAIELAVKRKPDVMIADHRLRGQRSGVDAIAEVRLALGEAVPALVVTGDTAPLPSLQEQRRGLSVLYKPATPGQLYRALATLLAVRAQ